jgi:alkylhydroperoxidase/carboxymuconolactone decarboxylase family protein YurZ
MDETSREKSPREKGRALFAEIYGEEMTQGMERHMAAPGTFGAKQMEWTLDFTFGEVWARPQLERRMRSCAVLGMLIGQCAEEEIRYHTKMGIRNGLTRTEIEEIFYTTFPYVGFPAANVAKRAMLAAFDDLDAGRP